MLSLESTQMSNVKQMWPRYGGLCTLTKHILYPHAFREGMEHTQSQGPLTQVYACHLNVIVPCMDKWRPRPKHETRVPFLWSLSHEA